MHRRQTIRCAALHVQLVGEFVDHHVDAVGVFGMFEPRDQHRATVPGFTEGVVVELMHHAVLVDDAARNHEVARIDHDADPSGVPVEAQMQDRQAGLQGDRQLDAGCQLQVLRAAPLLFGDELAGQLAQAGALIRRQVAEEGQAGLDFGPQRGGDFETIALASAPPGGELADHATRRVLSQMPAKIRPMPTA